MPDPNAAPEPLRAYAEALARMFRELSEIIGAGWRVRLELSPGAEMLMGAPAQVVFTAPRAPEREPIEIMYKVNRYALALELPGAVHTHFLLVFPATSPPAD